MRKTFYSIVLISICIWGLHTSVTELPEIQNPHLILADDTQLYIVESDSISIYSLEDLKKIRKFGKLGEGPGELKQYISGIDIQTDSILVNSIGRLSWFTRDGNFIRQTTDTTLGYNYKTFGNLFAGMRLVREKEGIYFSINIFSEQLKNPVEVYRYRHPFFDRKRKINPVDARKSSYFVHKGLFYVDTEGGIIRVFDQRGKEQITIDPGIRKQRMTPVLKEKYTGFWKSDLKAEYKSMKHRLRFPDHFPPIRDFQVADDRLYIFTHVESGNSIELIILDLKGKLLGKKMVPMADVNMLLPHLFTFYSIKNNHIYKLTDNIISETWELHIIGTLL